MFDIGLLEILLVLIVALIVLGPKELPTIARKLGQLINKSKQLINQSKHWLDEKNNQNEP